MAFVGVVGFTNTQKKFNYGFFVGWSCLVLSWVVCVGLWWLGLACVGLHCVKYNIIILI